MGDGSSSTKCRFLFLFLMFANDPSQFVRSTPIEKADVNEGKYCVENIEKDEKVLMEQIRDAKDWALTNGLTFTVPKQTVKCGECEKQVEGIVLDDMAQLVPFSLYPSPFPRELFKEAMDVHKAFQLLYFRAMLPHNFEIVKKVHENVMKTTNSLKQFAASIDQMHRQGTRQPLILYCNRADYFANEVIDEETKQIKYELKQVEMNGGVIGGYGSPPRVSELHRRMLSKVGIDTSPEVAPKSIVHRMVATALHRAWLEFGNSEAVILFLHAKDRNFLLIESRAVQYELERISNYKTKCFFLTLGEGVERLRFDSNTNSMILDGKYVVAVSISRNSISTNALERSLTLAMRRSTIIQVNPNVVIMAQSKKMQQALSMPGIVEKFLNGPDEAHLVAAVRKVLTKSWSISENEAETEEIIKKIKQKPENYVMKWNEVTDTPTKLIFFGEEIVPKLETMTSKEREQYFIMERLKPMVVKNHFVRAHMESLLNVDATAELGVHGCLLGNLADGTVLEQFWPEYQMRTKLAEVNEGGVMKGNSVVDSIYLV